MSNIILKFAAIAVASTSELDYGCKLNSSVSVLMMSKPKQGVVHAEAWNAWKAEADQFITSNGCLLNSTLNGYMLGEKLEDRPGSFFEKLSAPDLFCYWGNLVPCEYRLMKEAWKRKEANYTILVSADTVPLQKFSDIYNQLVANDKSIFEVCGSLVKEYKVPKHSQWITLRQSHARIIAESVWNAEHKEFTWSEGLDPPVVCGTITASDEYVPSLDIIRAIGREQFGRETNTGQGWPLGKRPYGGVFACWSDCAVWGKSHGPSAANWENLNETRLLEEMAKGGNGYWFIRKVLANTTIVTPTGEVSVSSWYKGHFANMTHSNGIAR